MKAETWAALIYLYHHGTASEWRAVYQAIREARGLALLAQALEPDPWALDPRVEATPGRLWAFVGIRSTCRVIQ